MSSRPAFRRPRPLPPTLPDVSEHWSLFGQVMENEGLSPRSPLSAAWMTPRTPRSAKWPPMRPHHAYDSIMARLAEDSDEPPLTTPPSEEHVPGQASTMLEQESDSDISEVSVPHKFSFSWTDLHPSNIPLLYRNILKCSLAYFLACMFTYNPWMSALIHDSADGPAPLSHMGHLIAIVALDFNPAKTVGAMLEADLFFIIGVIYASFVCLTSMTIFWSLELQPHWGWLADFLMILTIATSIGFIVWTKVQMASAPFNAACTMTAIIHFVVLVKQGGFYMLSHVIWIVTCGCLSSTLVSLLVWPQSATSVLQNNISKTIGSFSTLLELMSNTFLLEEGSHPPSFEKLQRAVEDHQNSFTKLKRQLLEAKTECYVTVQPVTDAATKELSRSTAYEDAVDSLNRLGQHLNGLRGGTRLQYELTLAGVLGPHADSHTDEATDNAEAAQLKAAAEIFGDLVNEVGRPLKNLTRTCTSSLKRLKTSFEHARSSTEIVFRPEEFTDLSDKIEKSLVEFDKISNDAVLRLYRRSNRLSFSDLIHLHGSHSDVAMTPENEQVFLLYFFIFTLQEFARELISLIGAMERIYTVEHRRLNWRGVLSTVVAKIRGKGPAPVSTTKKFQRTGLRKKISQYIVPESHRSRPHFPKIKPHAPDTVQTPSWSDLSFIGKIKHSIWAIGNRLRERDTKFAIKAGLGAAILATPAFIPSTRPIFVEWWGDWALISYFVVMSSTIGGTNYLSLHRIVATLGGAGVGALIYTLFPANALVLSIFGFFFSLPCFYFIVLSPYYYSAGRFVLLTYSIAVLYCYNLREREISAVQIAFYRSVAVMVGVTWAGLVSRFWWPSEARRELSKALSEFCLSIGWLYTRLVVSNSFARDSEDGEISERTALLANQREVNDSIQKYMAMELHLQIKLIALQDLLEQTEHEPRLKGPFPVQLYREILASLQTILDKLHSMRCVTTREEWYTTVRTQFIMPVNKEQHDLVGNIILFLSILASAFRSKTPLPPYLPPAEESRQRLVEAIRKLDVVRSRDVQGSRQLLFFAYALTMKGVTAELERLGETLQEAFGVMAPEFRGFFVDPKQSQKRLRFAV